jgi:hypothetical protein
MVYVKDRLWHFRGYAPAMSLVVGKSAISDQARSHLVNRLNDFLRISNKIITTR